MEYIDNFMFGLASLFIMLNMGLLVVAVIWAMGGLRMPAYTQLRLAGRKARDKIKGVRDL